LKATKTGECFETGIKKNDIFTRPLNAKKFAIDDRISEVLFSQSLLCRYIPREKYKQFNTKKMIVKRWLV